MSEEQKKEPSLAPRKLMVWRLLVGKRYDGSQEFTIALPWSHPPPTLADVERRFHECVEHGNDQDFEHFDWYETPKEWIVMRAELLCDEVYL